MQQGRFRPVVAEEIADVVEQGAAVYLNFATVSVTCREIELERQSALAKEFNPVVAPPVLLQRRTNRIVTVPAEAVLADAMLLRQLRAERAADLAVRKPEVDPLERENGFIAGRNAAEHLRDPDRFGAGEFAQTFGLGKEHVVGIGGTGLQKHRSIVGVDPPGRTDVAPAYRARHVLCGHIDVVFAQDSEQALPLGHGLIIDENIETTIREGRRRALPGA